MNSGASAYGQAASVLPEEVTKVPLTAKPPAVKVVVKWKSKKAGYYVQGDTLEEAYEFLKSKGKAWGKFTGELKYNIKFTKKTGDVTELVLNPTYTITMPRWPAYNKQSKQVKKSWDKMWKDLYQHELGHLKIFQSTVNSLGKNIKITDDPKKEKVEKMIKDAHAEDLNKQQQYDEDTNHGLKED